MTESRSSSKEYKIGSSFEAIIDKEKHKNITNLFKRITPIHEFEFMFFNYKNEENRMSMEIFSKILKFMKYRNQKNKMKLTSKITLDIAYTEKKFENYRLTIEGLENINKHMEMFHLRRNHVIFSLLVGLLKKKDEISLIKKVKPQEDKIDIDELNLRVRLSEEHDLSKDIKEITKLSNLDETQRENIKFRYKERASLIVFEDSNFTMAIDLTITKMHQSINQLFKAVPKYELEIDCQSKGKKLDKKYLDRVYNELLLILKKIQESNFVISKEESNKVLKHYKNLLGISNKLISLAGRKAQSLEIQHVTDKIENQYAVTDKADGERCFLILLDNKTYLITDNLGVKDLGIKVSKKEYNNSILDGELIFLPKYNKYIFMIFDCLYSMNNDIRSEPSIMKRLGYADKIVDSNFISKGQKGYKHKNYDGDFIMKKILSYHDNEIEKFMNALNHDIKTDQGRILIRRKYFIPVYGRQNNEIFQYSQLMWKKYVFDKNTNCPYILDGLIYHPLEQHYTVSAVESKLIEYKWKPPEKNSIDFYIRFEKDRTTAEELILFDNSKEEYVKNKPYKVCILYVGRSTRGKEQPVEFQKHLGKHIAYLFLEDGEVRDEEGNIIQDDTVVEMYYNNDQKINSKFKWTPMRTRYDKTEAVIRYQKKYGNYETIANKIWRSIMNPFTMADVKILSNDQTYSKHIEELRGKIGHTTILSEARENKYAKAMARLEINLRTFRQWIISILIYTYCNPIYEHDQNFKIMDLEMGTGEDIMKYYYVKVKFLVGVDSNNNKIMSKTNGAISRYEKFRKGKPRFPKMSFFQADSGAILDYDEQKKVLGSMSERNEEEMKKFFSKNKSRRTIFDRISCQFTIQKFLANVTVWNNFMTNINMYLRPGGYLLISCLDADTIINLLGENENYTTSYTDNMGKKRILFEIVKRYDKLNKKNIGLGQAIDVHNAIVSFEGNYVTENLVQKEFIKKELLEKCDLELVETDLFENQYKIHQDYFKNYAKYEDNPDTRKFLLNAAKFFDQEEEINKALYDVNKLYRYYVFRKNDNPQKKNQIGGHNDMYINNIKSVLDPRKFRGRYFTDIEYSLQNSICDILKESDIIPQSINMGEFYNDFNIKLQQDEEINGNDIQQYCSNISIGHSDSEDLSKTVLNGLNILILKHDSGKINIRGFGRRKKLSRKDPTILIYQDEHYVPLYRIREGKNIGLFNTNTKFIRRLINLSDNELLAVRKRK